MWSWQTELISLRGLGLVVKNTCKTNGTLISLCATGLGTTGLDYTGWPRKNATTLIINFKDSVNKTDLFFILLGRKLIFQQNGTMTINFG